MGLLLALNCSKQINCNIYLFYLFIYLFINRISKIEEGVDMADKPQVHLSIGIPHHS